jgi:tRNA(Ile)-lysidine synthase
VLEQVAKNIRERRLFRDGEHIFVAVSGGVDSIVLLHLLCRLAPAHRWRLTVTHFNHKLRGREGDSDERFVRSVAKKLNLAFSTDRADVKAHAGKTGQSIEMSARELRHGFFARTARAKKIKTIALAHNADDQVELFFLRLLRGTSVDGLSGMKWRSTSPRDVRIQLARPLLDATRKQIENFARENKLRWREDTSNKSVDFLRNRVRHELIPLLERNYQPAVRKNISRLMQLLAAEGEVLNALAGKPKRLFEKNPPAIQRRLLQKQLLTLNIAPDFATIESLRLNPGKVVEINPATRVQRDKQGRVHHVAVTIPTFINRSRKLRLNAGVTKAKFGACALRFKINQGRGMAIQRQPNTESFDANKVGGTIVLRHWQPGDRFQPIGAKSTRKLQDMFVDLKVPKEKRHSLVVATTVGNEIFWIEGIRIAERFRLTPNTKRRLVIRWKRD